MNQHLYVMFVILNCLSSCSFPRDRKGHGEVAVTHSTGARFDAIRDADIIGVILVSDRMRPAGIFFGKSFAKDACLRHLTTFYSGATYCPIGAECFQIEAKWQSAINDVKSCLLADADISRLEAVSDHRLVLIYRSGPETYHSLLRAQEHGLSLLLDGLKSMTNKFTYYHFSIVNKQLDVGEEKSP